MSRLYPPSSHQLQCLLPNGELFQGEKPCRLRNGFFLPELTGFSRFSPQRKPVSRMGEKTYS
jgi:hypothetical protein